MFGELIPVGGGDPIPLLKKTLRIGRRETCDVVLRFANVSGTHCILSVDEGYWFVRDLNSRNGVKVDGSRVYGDNRKRLDPGTVISVAKHKFTIEYSPGELGAVGPPPQDDDRPESMIGKPLLERAGLAHRKQQEKAGRYDVTDQRAGQLEGRDPRNPL